MFQQSYWQNSFKTGPFCSSKQRFCFVFWFGSSGVTIAMGREKEGNILRPVFPILVSFPIIWESSPEPQLEIGSLWGLEIPVPLLRCKFLIYTPPIRWLSIWFNWYLAKAPACFLSQRNRFVPVSLDLECLILYSRILQLYIQCVLSYFSRTIMISKLSL